MKKFTNVERKFNKEIDVEFSFMDRKFQFFYHSHSSLIGGIGYAQEPENWTQCIFCQFSAPLYKFLINVLIFYVPLCLVLGLLVPAHWQNPGNTPAVGVKGATINSRIPSLNPAGKSCKLFPSLVSYHPFKGTQCLTRIIEIITHIIHEFSL